MMEYPDTLLHIGGVWRPAHDGRTLPVLNPATGARIGSVAHAGIADLDEALAHADQGFQVWRRTSAFERSALLRRAAQLMRERAEDIGRVMTLEQGKPLREAIVEARLAGEILDWFAGEAQRIYGRTIPSRADGISQIVVREPIGPVAAFTPWNFPVNQAVRKIGAALAAGCSMVVKAPEDTPASPALLIKALVDAGLPAGVLNLVYGDPAEISGYLIPDPVIRKVSFTGSIPVGKLLAELAGRHMKRVTMELGGHAPVIVTADVDLGKVVPMLVAAKFRNCGQVCISPTRFLVETPIFDEFVDRFAVGAAAVKLGDGMEDETQMGPLVSERRASAVEALVTDAVERGARIATGGRRAGNQGAFFEPTILTDTTPDMRIMNEEPFGPVVMVNRFSDLADAITEANRLPVGLAAYAFTDSHRTAERLAAEVESGMLSINHFGLGVVETPFGGVRDSGYGSEGGAEAIEAYLTPRFVTQKF